MNIPFFSYLIRILTCLFVVLQARTKDLDQIQLIDLDPKNRKALENQPLDYEKPGLAQHYCVECAKYVYCVSTGKCRGLIHSSVIRKRYLETDTALKTHWKSKVHKRRRKELRDPAYTIEESERAAGLGRQGKRPESTQMAMD